MMLSLFHRSVFGIGIVAGVDKGQHGQRINSPSPRPRRRNHVPRQQCRQKRVSLRRELSFCATTSGACSRERLRLAQQTRAESVSRFSRCKSARMSEALWVSKPAVLLPATCHDALEFRWHIRVRPAHGAGAVPGSMER